MALLLNQKWLIYPDDCENLRLILKQHKLNVVYNGEAWEIYSGKSKRSKKQKDMTLVRDGAFAGARVESVILQNPTELTAIFKKCGLFFMTTKQTEECTYVFVGFSDYYIKYSKRVEKKRK